MTVIRFSIPLGEDVEKDQAEHFATFLQEEMSKDPALEQGQAAALGEGRSSQAFVAAVAVALPLIMDSAKTIDAFLGVWERFKKLKSPPEKTAEIFAKIDPNRILIDIDGVLKPLTKLTEDDIKRL